MWKVKIVEHGTNKVVKEMECKSERKAEKVDGDVNINLNHEQYYTIIEEVKE